MISIRSGLVGLAFVAMGLTAAVERLAESRREAPAWVSAETHAGIRAGSAARPQIRPRIRPQTGPQAGPETTRAPQSGRDDALRLTRSLPEAAVVPGNACKNAPGTPRI